MSRNDSESGRPQPGPPPHTQDPYTRMLSPRGIPVDQLVSVLQKEIRRSNVDNAVLAAYEMHTTSRQVAAHLWRRLRLIAVEDVGMGAPLAPLLLRELQADYDASGGSDWMQVVHAVRYLATAPKDRTSSEHADYVVTMVETGQLTVAVPDYALCVHTRAGQELGCDLLQWWQHGAGPPRAAGRRPPLPRRPDRHAPASAAASDGVALGGGTCSQAASAQRAPLVRRLSEHGAAQSRAGATVGAVDLARLFAELGDVTGPLPSDDAAEDAWAQYAVAAEFEAMLTGMVSRTGEPRDRDYIMRLRQLLADASLQRGLGDRLTMAEALVDSLSRRRM